jgi:integrase
LRYPPDPPTVEEIVAVMRAAGNGPDGIRLRGVIVALWRAGLRISEALALTESDLDRSRGAVLVRRGQGRQATRACTGRRPHRLPSWHWESALGRAPDAGPWPLRARVAASTSN